MSYFSLYCHEKCIGHNIKQPSADLSDLRYSVSLLQDVLDSVRYKVTFLFTCMKNVSLYSRLSDNDPMSHCHFTKHTEIQFPWIKVEGNHSNSIP